jgi:uncharacterized membrane protein YfcA
VTSRTALLVANVLFKILGIEIGHVSLVSSTRLSSTIVAILTAAFFVVAVLFSIVGHAGATGYLAVMGLLGVDPATMKPTALALNVLVAAIGTWQFSRAGHFRWQLFWPFAVVSVPAAYLGGWIALSAAVYKPIVGIALLLSALRFVLKVPTDEAALVRRPPLLASLLVGAGLGFLAGLTGIGGGVYLSPVLLWMHWATTREVSGVAAPFILVNSLAGLVGNWASTHHLPPQIPLWLIVVGAGGTLGAHLGSRRLSTVTLRRFLAALLILSGLKLLFSG